MVFILFVWVNVLAGPAVLTTQEFNSRKACVSGAKVLQAQFGKDMRFMCIEKGVIKK